MITTSNESHAHTFRSEYVLFCAKEEVLLYISWQIILFAFIVINSVSLSVTMYLLDYCVKNGRFAGCALPKPIYWPLFCFHLTQKRGRYWYMLYNAQPTEIWLPSQGCARLHNPTCSNYNGNIMRTRLHNITMVLHNSLNNRQQILCSGCSNKTMHNITVNLLTKKPCKTICLLRRD